MQTPHFYLIVLFQPVLKGTSTPFCELTYLRHGCGEYLREFWERIHQCLKSLILEGAKVISLPADYLVSWRRMPTEEVWQKLKR